jgi:RHS repeat-associated protein
VVVGPLVAHASSPSRITEWSIPTGGSGSLGITASAVGGDGNIWFVEYLKDKIGKMTPSGVVTEYALTTGSGPYAIAWGPDGNAWYVDDGTNKIGKITPSGSITEWATTTTGSNPVGITAGPDGNLWFTEYGVSKIGKITTSGTITEYGIGSTTNPVGITAGSDGRLWFAQETGGNVGAITTSGTVSQYGEPSSHTSYAIAAGPDGNVWFTDSDYDKIGMITTGGTATEYSVPTSGAGPNSIVGAPDGNVWFTEGNDANLGYVTPSSGTVTEITPGMSSASGGIGVGPDHNLWFTEWTANKIGRYELPSVGGALTAAQATTGAPFCRACAGRIAVGIQSLFPINTATGNFFHSFTDINIPGRSHPLALTRTYNSQNAANNSPFGYGWQFNYAISLAVTGTSPNQVATITQEDGSQATFNQPATGSVWPPSAPRFVATLTYNSGSSTWTLVRQGQDTYTFNSSGQLTQETDLNGYSTSLSYTSGNLTTITDPASRTLTLAWTGSNITSLTDSNVSGNTRTVTYQYNDGNGNLTDVIDVNGGTTHMVYDTSHRMTVMKDPVCQALGTGCPGVQNDYDSSSRVDWQKDQLNRKTSFAYSGDPMSATGSTTTITDPVSNVVVDTYQYGLRVQQTRGYGTSSASTTQIVYDPLTLTPTSIIDGNNNVTANTFDSSGNVLTTTDPLGRVMTYTYNSFNEVLTVRDGNGITTTNTYDTHGNLSSTSRPVMGTSCTCQVVTYNRTNATYPGDLTSIVDGDGKTTYFGYNTYGNTVETKDPLGNVSGSVFNAVGWLTASYTPKAACTWGSTPPTGCSSTYETQYSYIISGTTVDEFGDVQKVTDPLSHTITHTYDANRNVLTTSDGNGNTTTNAFDVANELCWTLPGGTSTNACASPPTNARVTDYNSDGTVADQKDGKGNAIQTYGYDPLARVITVTDALSNVTTYTLDANGNVLTRQDPGGSCTGTVTKCTTNTYDADSELKTVSYSDNSSENITSTTYDSDGQRTAMTDGTGSSSWVFDNLHRLTSYTNGNSQTVGYTYNLRNEPLTIVYPGTSQTATYTWDDAARMGSVKDWLSSANTTQFGYDANSNLTTDTFQSTATDTYGFNAADQMTSISDVKGATTLFAASYTRDSNGQLATDSSQSTNQRDYKYTALNQVCYAGSANTSACTSPPTSSYPYAYDNADNLTTMENAGHTGKNTQQFNAADELCWTVAGASSNACGSAPTGATTFGYDTKGNRTSQVPSTGSATCNTFDQANRLTEIQTGTGSTCTTPTTVGTYGFDGVGLRESKTVGSTTSQYTWDGMGGNLLQEKAGSATPTLYIYGPGNLPVEQINGTTPYFFHHDQIGSTRALSSSTGVKKSTFSYDPYGNVVACTAATVTINGVNKCTGTSIGVESLMYTGQYRDDESNVYYLRARTLDPATGGFLERDPMVAVTRSPYGYGAGDPLGRTDPSGLDISWGPKVQSTVLADGSVQSVIQDQGHGSLTVTIHTDGSYSMFGNVRPGNVDWRIVTGNDAQTGSCGDGFVSASGQIQSMDFVHKTPDGTDVYVEGAFTIQEPWYWGLLPFGDANPRQTYGFMATAIPAPANINIKEQHSWWQFW